MFFLPVALLTAAAAALINLWLGVRVSQLRLAKNIWVGDGGDARLLGRMRAQLNFAEYAPIVLVLLALVELTGASRSYLWAAAMVFILARICHAFGMDGWKIGRMIGAWGTILVMIGLAVWGAWLGYQGLNPLR